MDRGSGRGRPFRPLRVTIAGPLGRAALIAATLLVPPRARAGDAAGQDGSVLDSVLETMNIRAKPTRAPDFVEATRPDPTDLTYLATGAPHPKRPDPVKTAAQVKAAEAALDAARLRQLQPPPPAVKARPASSKTGKPARAAPEKPKVDAAR